MGVSVLGFGFLAGILSILSPCVLPVLLLVFVPAGAAHRFGALALAAGLVTSFVVSAYSWQRLASRSAWTAAWCAMWRLWCSGWLGSCC